MVVLCLTLSALEQQIEARTVQVADTLLLPRIYHLYMQCMAMNNQYERSANLKSAMSSSSSGLTELSRAPWDLRCASRLS